MKRNLIIPIFAAILLWSSSASAGVWFELLHAHCFTGSDDDIKQDDGVIGEVDGSIDCFNKDFNGGTKRTVFTIKAFQPWEYGFVFLYYDITGPRNRAQAVEPTPGAKLRSSNELGGWSMCPSSGC